MSGILGLATFGECNPCCEGCLLCADDFNRADNTDINTGSDCGWSEDAGSAEIATNRLRFTTASALARCLAVPSTTAVYLSFVLRTSALSNRARIILNYVDTNNYTFLEVNLAAAGTVVIFTRIAGTSTARVTRNQVFAANTDYECKVGVTDGGMVKAQIGLGAQVVCYGTTAIVSGEVALGTGTLASGHVEFDSFTLEKYETEDAPDCNSISPCSFACACCNVNETPDEVLVTLPTGIGDTAFCAECDPFFSGASFYVPHSPIGALNCSYNLPNNVDLADLPVPGCTGLVYSLDVTILGTKPNCNFRVTLTIGKISAPACSTTITWNSGPTFSTCLVEHTSAWTTSTTTGSHCCTGSSLGVATVEPVV